MIRFVLSIVFGLLYSTTAFSQEFSDVFQVDTLIDLSEFSYESPDDIIIKSNLHQVGLFLKKKSDDEQLSFIFHNTLSDSTWTEKLNYSKNFQFLIPTERASDFDFDSNYIVVRYADLTNYLCVFDRKTGSLESIIPSFEDFDQIKLLGDNIYFGKHYNSHPKRSPYKTIIGKINWRTMVLENIELPDFELIEFSHFDPNDWFDVNSEGKVVFSETLKYEMALYDENLTPVVKKEIHSSSWKPVDIVEIKMAIDSLGKQPSARDVITALVPWHDKLNRIQTVDFLNDSTLIVSKVVENQSDKERLRTFDIIRLTTINDEVFFKLILKDVPDLYLRDKNIVTKDHFEYRIRRKPHVYSNNSLFFIDTRYSEMKLGESVRNLDKQNNEAALTNEKKKLYLVIARFNGSILDNKRK